MFKESRYPWILLLVANTMVLFALMSESTALSKPSLLRPGKGRGGGGGGNSGGGGGAYGSPGTLTTGATNGNLGVSGNCNIPTQVGVPCPQWGGWSLGSLPPANHGITSVIGWSFFQSNVQDTRSTLIDVDYLAVKALVNGQTVLVDLDDTHDPHGQRLCDGAVAGNIERILQRTRVLRLDAQTHRPEGNAVTEIIEHTEPSPTPWIDCNTHIDDADGITILKLTKPFETLNPLDVHRAVACVNFCQHIPSEVLDRWTARNSVKVDILKDDTWLKIVEAP